VTPTAQHAKSASTTKTDLFALLRGPLSARGTGAPKIGQSRRLRLPFVFALAAILTLVIGVASASAAVEHKEITSFTGAETPAGSFGEANGVAVDAATGDVYVADIANNVVDKFTAAGKYICQITGEGSASMSLSECDKNPEPLENPSTPAGAFAFSEPAAVAVDNSTSAADPSAGDVYVLDKGHDVIDKFSAAGAYLGEVAGGSFSTLDGLSVDAAGNVWVAGGVKVPTPIPPFEQLGPSVEEFNPTGESIFHFIPALGNPPEPAFAVDSNDNTYLTGVHGVDKYDSTGSSLGYIDNCGFCQAAIATDLSTDDVYVDDANPQGGMNQPHVTEYDAAGETVIQFGETQLASGSMSGGIAVNPVSGDVYLANPVSGRVYVFDPAPGPRVVPLGASDIQTTSCTFNATVNPEGAATTYQFEYGTSTEYEQSLPSTPASAGSGTIPVAASAEPTDLLGGTTYHYRVVATNANGTIDGADRTCTTLPIPVIDDASATDLTSSTADLNAQINPEGSATTYHFDYGTSTAYGTSTPEASIPAGTTDTPVSAHIEGLGANTTYHWRVVATNANGTTTGVDHTFVYETTGGGLPDNRAYEMVTPPQKNAALIGATVGLLPDIAPDGSRVMLGSVQCFAGAGSCTADRGLVAQPFAFSRTPSGWVTTPLEPPATEFPVDSSWLYSAETGTALFSSPTEPDGEDDWYAHEIGGPFVDIGPATFPGYGASDILGFDKSIVATADLSDLVWNGAGSNKGLWPFDETRLEEAASVYEYAGAGNRSPILVGVTGGYENGENHDLIGQCGTEIGGGEPTADHYHSLSANGSRVFLGVEGDDGGGECASSGKAPPVHELYVRVSQSETIAISQPKAPETQSSDRVDENCTSEECQKDITEEANWRDASFEGASADGSKVFFTSTQQLTDLASQDSNAGDSAYRRGCAETEGANGCNLYEAELGEVEEAGSRKTIVKSLVAASAGDTSGLGPRVQAVTAISSDGSHVYFIAKGALSGNANDRGQIARPGADNFYVYERDESYPEGHTTFIATLPASSLQVDEPAVGDMNVTPDGRFLVFASRGDLTADDSSTSGTQQIFRYDAETGQLVRISIGEHGFNDNGNAGVLGGEYQNPTGEPGYAGDANIVPASKGFFHAGVARADPTMSDDGSYVFFESPVALTPRALNDVPVGTLENGEVFFAQNVYEYHEGQVYLISDGRDTSNFAGQSSVGLDGSDASGKNVFFTTADPLVAKDTDTQVDVYDARVCEPENGNPCIAEPAPAPAPCQGEACHGIPPAPPSLLTPGSASFNGQGNIAPTTVVKPKAKALTRSQKLADALKSCRKDRKKAKRQSCEKQARGRYGPAKEKAKAKKASNDRRGK
jgi:hypothetical protein